MRVLFGALAAAAAAVAAFAAPATAADDRPPTLLGRAILPRFQGANAEANLRLVEALRQVAEARGLTVAQAAIAWVAA